MSWKELPLSECKISYFIIKRKNRAFIESRVFRRGIKPLRRRRAGAEILPLHAGIPDGVLGIFLFPKGRGVFGCLEAMWLICN